MSKILKIIVKFLHGIVTKTMRKKNVIRLIQWLNNMYEIKIKGVRDSFMVDNKIGKEIADVFFNDTKYTNEQKIGIKNWMGTKGEIKSIYHVSEENDPYAGEKEIDPQVLKGLEIELLPFTEKRVWKGKQFDYLTREGELKFLQTKGCVSIENLDKFVFRVTQPKMYLGYRDMITALHAMQAKKEYAKNKDLQNLDNSLKNIGKIPK